MTERLHSLAEPKVGVIGSPMVDTVYEIENLEDLQFGAYVFANNRTINLRGKAPNASRVIARLGGTPLIVGKIGRDEEGDRAKDFLDNEGVGTRYLTRSNYYQTGRVLILYGAHRKGESYLDVTAVNAANQHQDPQRISSFFKTEGESLDTVYMTLEGNPLVVQRTARSCAKRNIPVFCDASPFEASLIDVHRKIFPFIDTLSPNHHEASRMTGIEIRTTTHARQAAEVFLRAGVKEVIIKRSNKGMYYQSADGTRIEVPPVTIKKPLHTVGAGDAAGATYLYEKSQSGNTEQALALGAKAGAFVVAHTIDEFPCYDELLAWDPA